MTEVVTITAPEQGAYLLPTLQGESMTSLEISELTGSRHGDVKRSIERLAASGVIDKPETSLEQGVDSLGRARSTEVYVFTGTKGRRDSVIVVAQLCPEYTAAVVDRWQELEVKVVEQAQQLAIALQERNAALELNAKILQIRAAESEADKAKLSKLVLAIQKKDLGAYAHDMAVAGDISLHKSGWENQEMLRQALCGAFVKHNEAVKLADQLSKWLPYELRANIPNYKERAFKFLRPTVPDLFLDSFKKVEILDYVEEGRKWMRANGREPEPLMNSLEEIARHYQRKVD